MLDERRVKEAENNVKNYLEEGLLTKKVFDKNIFNIFKNNASESLQIANFLYNSRKSSLWVITIAYYSMFYLANAFQIKL